MVSKLANEIFQFLEAKWHFVVAKIRYLKCTLITVFDILRQKDVDFLYMKLQPYTKRHRIYNPMPDFIGP